MEPNKALADRLKSLCEEKGMSYKELAEKSGLPVKRVYRLTYGVNTSPSIYVMLRICDALEITVDEFFSTEEFKEFRK